MHNYLKLTKTEAAFDKCSTNLSVLRNAMQQSIKPALQLKKQIVNNTFEEVFFSKAAGPQPATLFKMTRPQVSFKIFDCKCGQLFCRTCLGGYFYETEHYKDFTVAALFFTKDKLLQIIFFEDIWLLLPIIFSFVILKINFELLQVWNYFMISR